MHSRLFKLTRGVGGMLPLSSASVLAQFMPHFEPSEHHGPKRKSLRAPDDTGGFIKPLKQCFVKNPRLMPGTRLMLALLSGWAGRVGAIETTTATIGKHLSRSRRQVIRYLKDASEEGYITWSRTKDRMGYYTGIKLFLNFGAIRSSFAARKASNKPKMADSRDVTPLSHTNSNTYLNNIFDEELHDQVARLAKTIGVEMPNGHT